MSFWFSCHRFIQTLLAIAVALAATSPARAAASKAIQEAVEAVSRQFAAEVGQESAETLAQKLTSLAARHGDDAVAAFRKVGPRTFRIADEAGPHAGRALQLMARRGQDALWVVADPQRLDLVARFGDEAAEAMIRHKGLATGLIEHYHEPAARALNVLDGQNARRLAMLAEDGTLAGGHRSADLLGVIERFGNRAADFVWRNKGALAVGSVMAAFLSDPKPFIDGTRDLAGAAGEPVAEAVRETARRTNWTVVWVAALAIAGAVFLLRARRGRTRG